MLDSAGESPARALVAETIIASLQCWERERTRPRPRPGKTRQLLHSAMRWKWIRVESVGCEEGKGGETYKLHISSH